MGRVAIGMDLPDTVAVDAAGFGKDLARLGVQEVGPRGAEPMVAQAVAQALAQAFAQALAQALAVWGFGRGRGCVDGAFGRIGNVGGGVEVFGTFWRLRRGKRLRIDHSPFIRPFSARVKLKANKKRNYRKTSLLSRLDGSTPVLAPTNV